MNGTNFIQLDNPTYEERNNMIRMALEEAKRPEDFDNLVELLSPPQDITKILPAGSCKGIKVAIIGAGLAGLSSAFELRKLGFNITIFEMQENRVGGRVYTHYFDRERDLYGELGAMRIPVSHQAVWHYIDLFNLKTSKFIGRNQNAFIYIRNKRVRNDLDESSLMEEIYPEFNLPQNERDKTWQQLVSHALEGELNSMSPEMRREILQIKKEYSPKINALGSLSIRKVMELSGLSEKAIELISSISTFLGYFYKNSYIENLQEQYSVDYAFRYYIKGGMSNLPMAFYNSLTSKNPKEYKNISESSLGDITFKFNSPVYSIYKNDSNDNIGVYYREGEASKVNFEEFNYVICAIPFSALRNMELYPMFSTDKMQAIRELNYDQGQKTIFLCNNRFWEEGDKKIIGGSSTTDLGISTIWYPSNPVINPNNLRSMRIVRKYKREMPWKNPGVLVASYNLNQDAIRLGNDPASLRNTRRQVELVHDLPWKYLNSIIEDYKEIQWDNERGFWGGFCYYLPQQQQLFAYASAKPEYDNKVYFAGEHVGVSHAWMQGAIYSSMNAVNDLAENYKRKVNNYR